MYIFWNVIIWIFLCGCCALCIYMTVKRARRMQSMNQARNPGNMLNQNMMQPGMYQQPQVYQQQPPPQYQAFAGQGASLGGQPPMQQPAY